MRTTTHAAGRPALIFDFGNVIAHFDYSRACEGLGCELGLDGRHLLERLREAGLSGLVARYEGGRMTSEAFGAELCRLAGLADFTFDRFATAWSSIFWLNEPVAVLIPPLKAAGYRLGLGSNTNPLHAEWFLREFASTLDLFDRRILSFEIGHIKPAPEFFHACASAMEVRPADCVFIDDLPENVEGARAAGMTGLVYKDPHSLKVDLRRLGVEPAPVEGLQPSEKGKRV